MLVLKLVVLEIHADGGKLQNREKGWGGVGWSGVGRGPRVGLGGGMPCLGATSGAVAYERVEEGMVGWRRAMLWGGERGGGVWGIGEHWGM